ncbi:MAG: DUF2400 family protein [Fodinibius sp.]|nr:DUF2400 family protein [Fodinibius sp.]
MRPFLDQWVERIEQPDYIDDDPVLFMHAFNDKEDQLLAGFFAATMAWGRRDIVIRKVQDFLDRMDNRPTEFIANFSNRDADRFEGFKHRTFKPVDMKWLTKILQSILLDFGSFETFWEHCHERAIQNNRPLMGVFHEQFFAQHPEAPQRTRKHVSNAEKRVPASGFTCFCDGRYAAKVPLIWVLMNVIPDIGTDGAAGCACSSSGSCPGIT